MASKPLPKPAAVRTLQRKYAQLTEATNGRIDTTTDSGQKLSALLHRYFLAFSNLYGMIPVYTAWDIFREVEPELVHGRHILKKDFFAFTNVLRVEDLPYYILEIDHIYTDGPAGTPEERLLVNKKLVHRGYRKFCDLYTLIDAQDNKPYVVLNKEDYVAWASPDRFRKSLCAKDMLHFLETLRVTSDSSSHDINGHPIKGKPLSSFIFWHHDEQFFYEYTSRKWEKEAAAAENNLIESEKLMRKIERHIQLGDPAYPTSHFLEYFTKDLEEVGVVLKNKQFEKLMNLYAAFNNESRLWCNCGWTPKELAAAMPPAQAPSLSFGPNLQRDFANGDLDQAEWEQALREIGFTFS